MESELACKKALKMDWEESKFNYNLFFRCQYCHNSGGEQEGSACRYCPRCRPHWGEHVTGYPCNWGWVRSAFKAKMDLRTNYMKENAWKKYTVARTGMLVSGCSCPGWTVRLGPCNDVLNFFTWTSSEEQNELFNTEQLAQPRLTPSTKGCSPSVTQDSLPFQLVVFLPALCRKMGVPYCIIKGKARLGRLVHRKTCTCVAFTQVNP